jgi:DNA/RNA endonuclease G (NUC1)
MHQVSKGALVREVLPKPQAVSIVSQEERDAKVDSLHKNAPWGHPVSQAPIKILVNDHSIVYFSEKLRTPLWACYVLEKDEIRSGASSSGYVRDSRIDRQDLDGETLCDDDYTIETLIASEDQLVSAQALAQSRLSSNWFLLPHAATATVDKMNALVRCLANRFGRVLVVSGIAFDLDTNGKADSHELIRWHRTAKAAIPTHYFKIVVDLSVSTPGRATFSICSQLDGAKPSDCSNWIRFVAAHTTSIDAIEDISEVDWFSRLPHEQQALLESVCAIDLVSDDNW